MENGTRIILSVEGKETFPLGKKRGGVVVGKSNTPGCRRVLWDGPKQAETIHMDYLTAVTPPTPTQPSQEIARLNEWRAKAIAAADAILGPMTAEFGRIMEEAPDQCIELTLCSRTVQIPAGKFMALYRATDT